MATDTGWRTRVARRYHEDRLELLAILLANLIPLVGVVVWGWSLGVVLLAYWLESAVVGAVNVPKVVLACRGDQGDPRSHAERYVRQHGQTVTTCYYVISFGIYWAAMIAIFGFVTFEAFVESAAAVTAALPLLAVGVVGATVQHSVAAYREKRYLDRTAVEQIQLPRRRTLVLYLTVYGGALLYFGGRLVSLRYFGGDLSGILVTPAWALVVLVVLKTAVDVGVLEFEITGGELRLRAR